MKQNNTEDLGYSSPIKNQAKIGKRAFLGELRRKYQRNVVNSIKQQVNLECENSVSFRKYAYKHKLYAKSAQKFYPYFNSSIGKGGPLNGDSQTENMSYSFYNKLQNHLNNVENSKASNIKTHSLHSFDEKSSRKSLVAMKKYHIPVSNMRKFDTNNYNPSEKGSKMGKSGDKFSKNKKKFDSKSSIDSKEPKNDSVPTHE